MTVVESLEKLESIAKGHGLSLSLRPGASPEDLDALEAALGRPLPTDYRALLRFADGQEDEATFPWLPGCDRLAPVSAVSAQLAEERGLAEEYAPADGEELDGWILLGRYRPSRLPIAGTPYWDGDTTYVDLEPGSNGKVGQVVTLVSECDFVVLGESLGHALERYVKALTSGALVWHPDDKTLAPNGEAPHGDHPANGFALVK